MSKGTFKVIDIFIFAILAIITEIVIYNFALKFAKSMPVFVSFTIVLSLISIFRWGPLGTMVAVAGGLASAFARNIHSDPNYYLYLIYGIGNAFVALSYLFLIKFGRNKVKSSTGYLILYESVGYVLVILGRSILSLITKQSSFTDVFLAFFIPESIGFLLGIIILMFANKPNGILIEMNQYILDLHEEMREDKLHLKEIKESSSYDNVSDVTKQNMINDASLLEGGTLDQEDLKELQRMYDESLSKENRGKE